MTIFTEVDHDPFAVSAAPQPQQMPSGAKMVPVEGDPFSGTATPLTPQQASQIAPQAQAQAQLGAPDQGPQTSNIAAKGNAAPGDMSALLLNPEVAKDAAIQFGEGATTGFSGLVGLPRDASNLAKSGIEAGAGMLGFTPDQAKSAGSTFEKFNPGSYLPSSADISSFIHNGNEPIPAQSKVGEYTNSIAQMLPAAATGGGGLARVAAEAIIPGVASQVAGDLPGIKGTAAEPWVRGAAALASGVPTAALASKTNAIKDLVKSAPKQSEVAAAKNALYDTLEKSGVKYDANTYQQMATDLSDKLKTFRAAQAPLGADAVNAVKEQIGKPMNFTDFDSLRQTVGSIIREPSATNQDRAVASIIMDHLNKFEKSAPLSTNGLIPADKVSAVATQARDLARRDILAKQLNEIDRKAPNYVSGTDSGIKNQAATYLKSQKGKGLSDLETQAFEKMARREGVSNVISNGGSRLAMAAGHSVGPIVGGALGSLFGPVGTAVGAGIGGLTSMGSHMGLRALAAKSAENSLQSAKAVVLAGRNAQDMALTKAASNSTSRNLRTIAAGVGAEGQFSGHSDRAPPFRLPSGAMFWNPSWDDYQQYNKSSASQ